MPVLEPTPPASQLDTSIAQVALTVRDVAASTAFYRDQVGLPFLFGAGPSLAFLGVGPARLMLSGAEGELRPGGGTVLYLKVADLDATYATLLARGVAFVDRPHLVAPMPDHDLWMCFFKDPDGYLFGVMEERAKGAGARA